jgi:hypothetical protein
MTNLTRTITLVLGLLTGPAVFTQASYADGGPVPLPPCWPCSQGSSLTYYNAGGPLPLTVPASGGMAQTYFDGTGPVPLPPCWPCSQGLTQHSKLGGRLLFAPVLQQVTLPYYQAVHRELSSINN